MTGAYSRLMAATSDLCAPSGSVPSARRAASASATVAPSGSESGNDVAPACSRSDAKSRTVISMTEKANPQLTHLDASGAAGSWRR